MAKFWWDMRVNEKLFSCLIKHAMKDLGSQTYCCKHS